MGAGVAFEMGDAFGAIVGAGVAFEMGDAFGAIVGAGAEHSECAWFT